MLCLSCLVCACYSILVDALPCWFYMCLLFSLGSCSSYLAFYVCGCCLVLVDIFFLSCCSTLFTSSHPCLESYIAQFVAKKWMRVLHTIRRCNQNTNGACEAWHGTLKRMVKRKIGFLQSMRCDQLIYHLFSIILPFFWYMVCYKQLGRIINYKKEEIIVNSLHKAMHSMRDHQIIFPNLNRPQQALFTSLKPNKPQHLIHNIYSTLPSCDCKWANEGNICKHQLKALLVKGHSGGLLV